MMQPDDLYAKVFVAGAANADVLTDVIRTDREAAGRTPDGLDVVVRAQSRHLPLNDEEDDFLNWRHCIDLEAGPTSAPEDFLEQVAQLVARLRERGLRVVAACEFEYELEAAVRRRGGN